MREALEKRRHFCASRMARPALALIVTAFAVGAMAGQAAATQVPAAHPPVPVIPKVSNPLDLHMPAMGKHLAHRSGTVRSGSAGAFTSTNWDGYFASEPGSATNQTTFNNIQAQWKVQPVTCDPNTPQELQGSWVGFDGWDNSNVEQGGTEALCVGSSPFYFTWWEMFPANGIQREFAVNPGDTINASVTFNQATSEFDIVIADVTSGQTLTEDTPCQPQMNGCARSTAEIISEDIFGGADTDGLFALPNYGTNAFMNISLTDVNGNTGTLANPNWTASSVNEVSSAGVTKQTTGQLSPDGSSFTTTWQSEFGSLPAITADYQTPITPATTNQPSPQFELINNSNFAVPLSDITIRYWFTEDGSQPLQAFCDFSPVGCSNIIHTFVTTSLGGQDHYLQIGFTPGAGALKEFSGTGIIQTRFSQTSFANMTQTNDYSFDGADTSFTANPHITVYDKGTLIYGTEP